MVVNTVVINNKTYKVPEFTFGVMRRLEENGFPVMKIADIDNNSFTALHAFTMVVCDVDSDEADRLLQQHLLGGHDFSNIMKALSSSITESDFFIEMMKRMKKEEEVEVPTPKKPKSKKEETTEVSEN